MASSSALRNPHLEGSSFYWEAGSTGILLCHGFTATTAEVRLLAEVLHNSGYTVSAPLLPGHGTSAEDCNRYSWQDWYDAVEQAYLELTKSSESVVVGGESMGALLALRLSALHPEVSAVLCYAPALKLLLGEAKTLLLYCLAPFLTSFPKPPATDDNPWQGYSVEPLKGAVQLLRLEKDVLSHLPEIHQSILLLQGKLDPIVHPDSPRMIFERVNSPTKALHWLENSTHCVILDKERDLAANLTLDFLKHVLL